MLDLILPLALLAFTAYVLWRRHRPVRLDTSNTIILDGSNVLHWKDETPRLQTLIEVLDRLQSAGYTPVVIFDANAGYLVSDRYMHHHHFAKALGLSESQVMVVPKGEPADPTILKAARSMKARVVSNDRFRDWAGEYGEVRKKGFLVSGGYRGGRLEMRVPKATVSEQHGL
jgi:hypothetical protein